MAIQAGRNPQAFDGLVNTPVCRGSTILASSLEEWEARKLPNNPYASYGRFGTATTRALESSVARLEGGHASLVFPSGLAACAHALLAVVRSGDHVLITDSVYGPTRHFATHVLSRLGVEVEFYGPHETTGLRSRLRRNTRLVFVESPGSLTFEIQDIGAIAEQARTVGALVIMDNTWATPLFFKPFEHGVDISIQSATKYLIGHSDALLGVATANARAWDRLREGAHDLGQTAGPDDIFLALRGIRSLGVRLRQHESNGIALAQALRAHPLVRRVLHPALPDDPGHRLWRRDFLGASGLFAIELQPVGQAQLSTLFSRLQLFGIGLSWGGYESLALPVGTPTRSVSQPALEGPLIRIHAGLENIQDLIDDFSQALSAARLALS
ncbi:MAG: cystathionine beta-lyase [Hydrogenophaga sp.]|nr:cystathionine beta-lyase [Hydrogenophaga sp.]